jgi:hypothetical protein
MKGEIQQFTKFNIKNGIRFIQIEGHLQVFLY